MKILIPYQKERIEGAIAFFASKHKEQAKQNLSQTALYKYLAFFDFKSLNDSGEPALGLTYIAMPFGPVPQEIYKEKKYIDSKYYKFHPKGNSVIIIPTSHKPDYLEYFSEYDMELMNDLIEIFATLGKSSSIMSEASHENNEWGKAWRKTRNKNPNSIINMADHFDNLEEKYKNNTASIAEEHFFIYQKLHAN